MWRRSLPVVAVLASLAIAGCGSSKSSETKSASSTGSSSQKYTVFLSNNYMGNEWRPQMENIAKYIASQEPYGKKISLQIRNSTEATPASQIQSLQTIVREKPNAIMVDAASPTALDPALEQACAAGILVYTFDQVANASCAYKLPEAYEKEALDMANWIGTELKGKGNILMDTGLPGIAISTTFLKVWKKTLAEKYPGIKVVGTFSSQYAPGPELQGVSQDLAQASEVNGILSGGYCSSDVKALKRAGRKLVPMTCLDVNGNEQVCESEKLPCFFFGAPAYVSGVAIEHIVSLLEKSKSYKKEEPYYETNFVSKAGNIEFAHTQKVEPLKPGVNYYPTESAALITPITYGKWNMTAEDVLKG
ncbi:MAG: substrate-binding domain-containing protein [Solirubrobacteraceae bacterium]